MDNETLLHIDAENRRQTLEEELEFLKQVHEQVAAVCIYKVVFHHHDLTQNCTQQVGGRVFSVVVEPCFLMLVQRVKLV